MWRGFAGRHSARPARPEASESARLFVPSLAQVEFLDRNRPCVFRHRALPDDCRPSERSPMKFVIYPAIEPDRLLALQAAADESEWVNAATAQEAEAAMPGTDAFLGKITPAMLARANRLVWVQAFTASLEHYIFPELQEHHCLLTNVRGLFGDVIADQVMGYVVCFARNLHTYVRQQIAHRWEPAGGESARVSSATGPGTVGPMDRATIFLPNAKMGIIGMGGIGCEVARRALAFKMSVRGVDRFPNRARVPKKVESVQRADRLPELLEWCDFAVIAAPQTPETVGWFNAGTLAALRPGSYLINVGRGAIVVLDDLVAALRAGRLAGAALDVYETEPLPADHPLWDLPNVILTPHTAGYSPVIAKRHLAALVENVRRFARRETLINVVNKTLWF
jgi:phosphoglycerate dehydrogenase-like enzyme